MADALDVQCPDCGAPPKTECYTSSASVASDTHINRIDLANIEHGTCALCTRRLARLNGRRWHTDGDASCPPLPDPNVDWNAYAAKVNDGMAAGDPGDANFAPLPASPVLCPECSNGKHSNCDGTALYPDDSLGPCQCASDAHNPPESYEQATVDLGPGAVEEEFVEGCPDCRNPDSVVDQEGGGVRCTACGWRD